jgi:hypothetical protein
MSVRGSSPTSEESGKTKCSFVIVGRNDGYGGNFLDRLTNSIDSICTLSREQNLSAELLLVEWNPPSDRERFVDAIDWPDSAGDVAVRIIEVPNELHRQTNPHDAFPVCEFVGKNVGIRRALGEFVVVTNADIIVSRELISHLATAELSTGTLYRGDRIDVDPEIPVAVPLEDKLERCKRGAFRRNTIFGQVPVRRRTWATYFMKALRQRITDGETLNVYNLLDRVANQPRKVPGMLSRFLSYRLNPERFHYPSSMQYLHTEACGDFMMMAKSDWEDIRGFPEFSSDGLRYIDGYGTVMAIASGKRQEILNSSLGVYHQEHERSFESMPSFAEYAERSGRMLQSRTIDTDIQNGPDWGFGDRTLEETVVK